MATVLKVFIADLLLRRLGNAMERGGENTAPTLAKQAPDRTLP
jgi:hypothetical protein